jgi:hypothetical protein
LLTKQLLYQLSYWGYARRRLNGQSARIKPDSAAAFYVKSDAWPSGAQVRRRFGGGSAKAGEKSFTFKRLEMPVHCRAAANA